MKHATAVWIELALTSILVLFLLLLKGPLAVSLSIGMVAMVASVFVVLFILVVLLAWKERARDERERLHRMIAGRIGFLTGASIAVIGIVVQIFHHMYEVDSWLVLTLGVMLIAHAIGTVYGHRNS